MSVKEEQYVILEDEVSNKLLVAEVIGNEFILSDHRSSLTKIYNKPQSNKYVDEVLVKKEYPLNEIQVSDISQRLFHCAVCQIVCVNCKSICVTCKYPCKKCGKKVCENSTVSTDTEDFDIYLESLTKKVKPPNKFRTVGTDTCDLEAHFDYYKSDKKTVVIQKHVATDCIGLSVGKSVHVKKPVKYSVAIDTSDLNLVPVRKNFDDESDYEFFWSNKKDTKTYSKKQSVEKTEEKNCNKNIAEESFSAVEDVTPDKEEHKAASQNIQELLEFEGSASEDSDVDPVFSSRVINCQKLAQDENITLNRIAKDKKTFYECSICKENFFKKREGILHLENHVGSNSFKCLSCSENFENLYLLRSHIKDKHISILNAKPEGENKENSRLDFSKAKSIKIYLCTLCQENQTFESYKALHLHKKDVHGICGNMESDGGKMKRKPRVRREHICLICGKEFKSTKALKDHSPVHTGQKNYQCDICKKSYTTSANLKIHKRTHTGAKNFVCNICEKAFHKKDSLKVHLRKHSGERPFHCDLCPMKFDRNYILKNHRYTHFSDKKYICPVCGKTFTTNGGLMSHEKGHNKDPYAKKPRKPAVKPTLDAENAVICDVCGKIYSTRSNLRIHKLVHLGLKPFECSVCHQTYAKKDSMLTHMRKHTDDRPFACEICGMTFYRNHTLKTHLLRHTGERPHKCKKCGKGFTQSSSLAYHLKNHDKKMEKKKAVEGDPMKVKKKRPNPSNKLQRAEQRAKKMQRVIKYTSGIHGEVSKPSSSIKKVPGASSETVSSLPSNLPIENESKGTHFMAENTKEIIMLEKQSSVEPSKNSNSTKEAHYYSLEKSSGYGTPSNSGKFNYYITKNPVFSIPKHTAKGKKDSSGWIVMNRHEEDVGNVIVSKNTYVTKEGHLVTLNREATLKDVKELVQIEEERSDFLKPQTAIPITGEILNAAFVTDENGDVVPLSSMTLQGLGGENVMISPLISVENEDRRGFMRNPKWAQVDSKIAYNLAPGSRSLGDKIQPRGNYHIISLRDPRIHQKIEMETTALQIQGHVDGATLHGIPTFYSHVQQNEM